VSTAKAMFGEVSAQRQISQTPLAHVSIELGHLYMEDFVAGADRIRAQFRSVAPWAETVRTTIPHRRPRVSTCFLIDDYFSRFSSPAELLPMVIDAAAEAGVTIDYLARESGCARNDDGQKLAELVEDRLVSEPVPGANGARPPVVETGWLCNGRRSPTTDTAAMAAPVQWRPPVQNAARRHSIFVDVELWDEDGTRTWSCPYLAAVWQLLRLGALREYGRPVANPVRWQEDFPQDWESLPSIIQLSDSPAPFSAYRTVSILSARFLPIEVAVRTILDQVLVDPDVLQLLNSRARSEGIELAPELVDRIGYVFLADV
jgi:hypothetical protein